MQSCSLDYMKSGKKDERIKPKTSNIKQTQTHRAFSIELKAIFSLMINYFSKLMLTFPLERKQFEDLSDGNVINNISKQFVRPKQNINNKAIKILKKKNLIDHLRSIKQEVTFITNCINFTSK